MIEFNGYLTGSAENRFHRKSRDIAQNIFLFAVLALFPSVIFFGIKLHTWKLIATYCLLFILIPLLVRIPKSKKERISITPKRIYIEENHIVCISDRYTESRFVSDVIKVIDNEEFYELCFPFGKVSEKYICQKSLLTKGSLVEFEALFGDKIIRR